MITSKEVKIKIPKELTSQYIENELNKLGYDILRWVIVNYDKEFYTLNIIVVE